MFEYAATVIRVVDGDTYELDVDLGWSVSIRGKIRLLGVDAPEMNTQEGKDAANFVKTQLYPGRRVTVKTTKADPSRSFVRYLGEVWLHGFSTEQDTANLADVLVGSGHAMRIDK